MWQFIFSMSRGSMSSNPNDVSSLPGTTKFICYVFVLEFDPHFTNPYLGNDCKFSFALDYMSSLIICLSHDMGISGLLSCCPVACGNKLKTSLPALSFHCYPCLFCNLFGIYCVCYYFLVLIGLQSYIIYTRRLYINSVHISYVLLLGS